jgi:excisionase family DNA binding protein
MRQKAKMTAAAGSDQPVALQRLLTVGDVALLLGLSRVKVYDLMKTDGLPSIKIKGARRIQPGKLKIWIDQHSEE